MKTTTLSRLLQSLVSQGHMDLRAQRQPDLSFQHRDERFVWVCDGETKVGLIDRKEATLEWIAPHPGRAAPRPVEIPEPYHAPSYQGGRIISQWWINPSGGGRKIVGGAGWRVPPKMGEAESGADREALPKWKPQMEWEFSDERGAAIHFRIVETFHQDAEARGEHHFTLYYDPLADSYVAEVDATLHTTKPYFVEFCNFYTGGVYDSRPGMKRYRYTIWTHPDGRFIRWPHNPVGYMTPGMNDPLERSVADGGFIGYFSDPYSNPVLEVLESNPKTACATCCNIYDEHLIHLLPDDPDALAFTWKAHFKLYSVHAEVAQAIEERSALIPFGADPSHPDPVRTEAERQPTDLSTRIVYHPCFPGFYYGRVNDFEMPIPFDRTVAGSMLFASSSPDHEVYWEEHCGHSGNRSIRLRGGGSGEVVRTTISGGSTPHIFGGRRYRLSGWIRCEGVEEEAGARIRFDEVGMKPHIPGNVSHVAGPLSGSCDWAYVETRFTTPPDAEFGWLHLELEGRGQAWFDDIALEEE